MEISEEAQAFFLASDDDLETLKTKAAKYGRDLKAVPIDRDCLLHAIHDQTHINPNWTIQENRQTIGFYLAKLPEQFYMFVGGYCTDQSYESYVRNFFNGHSYGDEVIAGVWGHIWNMKIIIISPYYEDLKVFHNDDENPDIVIVHNGRADTDEHYFSTSMHNKRSKKLPVIGSNHSFKITVLKDVNHHYKNAQEHYNEVKRHQCINGNNTAVNDLSELYHNVMQAKELEQELSGALKEVQTKITQLKSSITTCDNRLILTEAKLQNLGISTASLNKPKPISQGTQSDLNEDEKGNQEIVVIEDTEADKAVKEMLASENISMTQSQQGLDVVTTQPSFTVATPQKITLNPQEQIMITPQNTGISVVTSQNAALGVVTTQKATTTLQNVVTRDIMQSQSVVTLQNISGQQEIIIDADQIHYTPVYPPGIVGVPSAGLPNPSEQQQPACSSSTIPKGFKRTKFEDTLEKVDLKPVQGQKAPKRFFCARCMKADVEIGYTKRNDLSKHLEGCGVPKEKKFKCNYENCNAAYIRQEYLKQHIATEHTKQFLYHCKKCQKGFTSSPLATAHRKICYPDKPKSDHTVEDTENKGDETKEDEPTEDDPKDT